MCAMSFGRSIAQECFLSSSNTYKYSNMEIFLVDCYTLTIDIIFIHKICHIFIASFSWTMNNVRAIVLNVCVCVFVSCVLRMCRIMVDVPIYGHEWTNLKLLFVCTRAVLIFTLSYISILLSSDVLWSIVKAFSYPYIKYIQPHFIHKIRMNDKLNAISLDFLINPISQECCVLKDDPFECSIFISYFTISTYTQIQHSGSHAYAHH